MPVACSSSAANAGHICAERSPSSSSAPARLAELDLGDRREHAGGDARGAAPERVALEQRHVDAALRARATRPPGR